MSVANWNGRQNDLTIKILEKSLKRRIRRITLDRDLTPLLDTTETTGNDRMPARCHHIVAMGGHVGVEYTVVLIAQDHEAIFSVATSPTNQALQECIEVGCFLREFDEILNIRGKLVAHARLRRDHEEVWQVRLFPLGDDLFHRHALAACPIEPDDLDQMARKIEIGQQLLRMIIVVDGTQTNPDRA